MNSFTPPQGVKWCPVHNLHCQNCLTLRGRALLYVTKGLNINKHISEGTVSSQQVTEINIEVTHHPQLLSFFP